MYYDFEDEIYEEHYDQSYRFLKNALSNDLKKEINILETTLENMLTYQGNDWTGRGDISSVKLNAYIAAAEALKEELKEKLKQANK
ncbi:MAG: hypothetical protein N4A54_05835 [Peptostreptococcaceae bacterium]|jgi:hypothetical protein|nr:hypothetical protein [Peptostreptococcaceae bacterium]